ncbi:MAG: YbaK/EbsC family protein [Deltaproteobacteria bacterium]|nr:YbaK/EbsC family protein [Deltaproteobacteria bacterium]
MGVVQKLADYLESKKIKYQEVPHREAYTAQEVAQSVHARGQEVVKVVVVKGKKKFYMLALPASYKVDLDAFSEIVDEKELRLATEGEIQSLFPECEVGAMPPFGNLWKIDVYADKSLAADKEIWIQPGSHTSLIKISFADFKKLVKPKVEEFARKQVA